MNSGKLDHIAEGRNTHYIPALDGLRGLAVLLVMAFHFDILGMGWVGVQLFFVLSGYLITDILLREKETEWELSYLLKRFYWRRVLRIFPLYYFYIFAILGISVFVSDFDYSRIPSLLVYTYNLFLPEYLPEENYYFDHLWSLCVEEQFYLAWPLVILSLKKRTLKWVFPMILLLGLIFRFLMGEWTKMNEMDEVSSGVAVYTFTLSQIDAFAIGGVIPLFGLNKREMNLKRWGVPLVLIVMFAGGLNHVCTDTRSLTSFGFYFANIENYQHVWSYTLLNLGFGFLILSLLNTRDKNVLSKWMEYPPWMAMGRVSYGMYVYHFFPIIMLRYLGVLHEGLNLFELIALFVPFCLGVFVLSWISYQLFERRFINLKDLKYPLKRSGEPL